MKKILSQVLPDEIIEHTGDLVIQGNIGHSAKIILHDGSLTVEGNVEPDANINLMISDSLQNNSFNTGIIGKSTRCNIMMQLGNQSIMIGNVNIDNRILTNDKVFDLCHNQYKVVGTKGGIANVIVDGIPYAGTEILINGKEVVVDGVKASQSTQSDQATHASSHGPFKLLVMGSVGNNTVISSDAEIKIENAVGKNCEINSKYGAFKATDIGENTQLIANNEITVGNVANNCSIKSKSKGFSALLLNNNVTVHVADQINISGNIGDDCQLQSDYKGLNAGNLGKNSSINVSNDIAVKDVGKNSKLKSTYSTVTAENISDNVDITASNEIHLRNVGNRCTAHSLYKSILVKEHIGNHATLEANEHIDANSVGDYSQLKSNYKEILLRGNAGDFVSLSANKRIRGKDIGRNSTITSQFEGVSLHNLGENVSVNASKDIEITGTCPANVRLNTTFGKVKMAFQSRNPFTQFSQPSCASNADPKGYLAILKMSSDTPDAQFEETLKKHFKELVLIYHPDKQGINASAKKFTLLKEAYDYLLDPENRASYIGKHNSTYTNKRS